MKITPIVSDYPVEIKRIVTTSEGRLQVVIETDCADDDGRLQAHRLLELQRGTALLTLIPGNNEVSAAKETQSTA